MAGESGRDCRLLSDRAGCDNLHFDFSYPVFVKKLLIFDEKRRKNEKKTKTKK